MSQALTNYLGSRAAAGPGRRGWSEGAMALGSAPPTSVVPLLLLCSQRQGHHWQHSHQQSVKTPCPGPGIIMQPGLSKHIMRCLLSPGCRVCPATASLGYLLAYWAPGLWSSSKSVCTQPRCFCKAFHGLWQLIRAGSCNTHSIQIPNGTES